MRRGTTPTHTFTLPFDSSIIQKIRIVYAQQGRVVLTKTGDDVTISGNVAKTILTQQETLAFSCARPVEIQVRVLTIAGDVQNSDIVRVSADRCLDGEVLT